MSAARPARRPWTAAERADLTARLDAGETCVEIAAALGRTEGAVRNYAARMDLTAQRPARRPWTAAERADLAARLDAGENLC